MSGKNLFFLGVAVIVGVSMWLYYSFQGVRETQKAVIEQAQRLPRPIVVTAPTTSPNPPAASSNSALKARLTAEALRLQQELIEENSRMEAQRQNLETLRARQGESIAAAATSSTTTESYNSQISSANEDLRTFVDELNSYTQLERDIQRQADTLLRDINSQEQVVRDQLEANIQQQKDLIQQTQEDLLFWQYNFNDQTARQNRLTELESLLTSQQQQLDLMQSEKLLLASQVLERSREIQQARELALEEVKQNRRDLQDEITALRDEVQDLQENLYRSRLRRNSMFNEIQATQRTYQEQQQKVRKLESSLEEKNVELNKLE